MQKGALRQSNASKSSLTSKLLISTRLRGSFYAFYTLTEIGEISIRRHNRETKESIRKDYDERNVIHRAISYPGRFIYDNFIED